MSQLLLSSIIAWLTRLAGDRVEVRSAGSAPAGAVNPAVAGVMREAGIDISAETPKGVTSGRRDTPVHMP